MKVTRARPAAGDVVTLCLSPVGGEDLPPCPAGSHVDVTVDTAAGPLLRQYSVHSSSPSGWSITVRREPDSRGGSVALCSAALGDVLEVSAPRNFFPLRGEGPALLVAGGIGVTPLLAMAQKLEASGGDYRLLYFVSEPRPGASKAGGAVGNFGGESRLDSPPFVPLREELAALGEGRVRLFRGAPRGEIPAIVAEQWEALASTGAQGEAFAYVCGPQGFMDSVTAALPPGRWACEHFRADPRALAGERREFRILLAGEEIVVPADSTAAEAMEAADVPVLTRCSEGTCGTCIMRVVGGTPDHRDSVLSEEQHAAGLFTPCCSRAVGERLELARLRPGERAAIAVGSVGAGEREASPSAEKKRRGGRLTLRQVIKALRT